MSTIYKIENGKVIALDGECYTDELEAYKALAERQWQQLKAMEAKAEEAKIAVWKQPFKHACTLHFAGGSHMRFPTLRKAFEWAVRGRRLTSWEEKAYRRATHSYKFGCKGAIRAQFDALHRLIEAYRGETRLVKLERTGRDGNIYTAEAAK